MAKKRFELGLAKDYVADWTVLNAVREFMQNAIDQSQKSEDNAYNVSYNEELEELRISNKSSVLEKSSLLLGTSTKNETDIGGFGEGYKLACLVMVRNGIDVRFENYGAKEIWTFKFSKLKKYDYKESLVCDVETQAFFKKVPNDNLTIVLTGLKKEQYEEYLELLIKEDAVTIDTDFGRILMDPEYQGKVYVNGLFVAKKDCYEYGYDIKPQYIKIGRDRNLIADWDLSDVTRNMWLLSDDNTRIMDMLERGAKDVEHFQYARTYSVEERLYEACTSVADSLYEDLENKYGEGVILASSEDSREKLSHKYIGHRVVVANDNVASLLEESSTAYRDVLSNAKNEDVERSIEDRIYCWATDHYVSTYALTALFDILSETDLSVKEKNLSREKRDELMRNCAEANFREDVVESMCSYKWIDKLKKMLTDNDVDEEFSERECQLIQNEILEFAKNNFGDDCLLTHYGDVLDSIDDSIDDIIWNYKHEQQSA